MKLPIQPLPYNPQRGVYQLQQAGYVQPLPLLQNVILNNDPYTYNPQRRAYQKTDAQPERVFVFQHQPQPVSYVQPQPFYAQPLQFQQKTKHQIPNNNLANNNMHYSVTHKIDLTDLAILANKKVNELLYGPELKDACPSPRSIVNPTSPQQQALNRR